MLESAPSIASVGPLLVPFRSQKFEKRKKIAGEIAWEAEVIAADGQAYDVLLDVTGEVLDIRRDD